SEARSWEIRAIFRLTSDLCPLSSVLCPQRSWEQSLISDLITALRNQSQRLLCLRRQRAGHAQTLIALIAHQRMARFRSEHTIDLSVVITCSRQFILQVRHHRGRGFIVRSGAIAAPIVVVRLIVVIVAALIVGGRI